MLISDSELIVPVLNSMLDKWPSPTARRLMTNRSSPGLQPAWSGCGTIDGLNNAAASSAYSRSELYARQVAFAHSPQAHDESEFPGPAAGLVGMRHDRRVEQRRGLQRVLQI